MLYSPVFDTNYYYIMTNINITFIIIIIAQTLFVATKIAQFENNIDKRICKAFNNLTLLKGFTGD